VHLKKKLEGPYVFRNPLRPIPYLTASLYSPAARELISVAIPFDHLRKKRALMQKANVSHGKAKMDKMVRRSKLLCDGRSRSFYKSQVVRGAMPMSMERKKVVKKQRRSKEMG
jgi:hypothetical protein